MISDSEIAVENAVGEIPDFAVESSTIEFDDNVLSKVIVQFVENAGGPQFEANCGSNTQDRRETGIVQFDRMVWPAHCTTRTKILEGISPPR